MSATLELGTVATGGGTPVKTAATAMPTQTPPGSASQKKADASKSGSSTGKKKADKKADKSTAASGMRSISEMFGRVSSPLVLCRIARAPPLLRCTAWHSSPTHTALARILHEHGCAVRLLAYASRECDICSIGVTGHLLTQAVPRAGQQN